MQLEELFDYKNQLMEDLLTIDTIVKLINEDATTDSAPSLVYEQVFPYEYIPDTIEHAHTFICCDVDIQKVPDKTFLYPVLYVWVFSHKSKLRLPEGGVRTDRLVSEIAKAINGSRLYGIGELDLYSVKRFAPVSDYQGKVMTFHAKDWNRPAPSKMSVPSNRKRD